MLKRLFNNSLTLKIISVLIAFVAWLIVIENVDRESYATFRDISIDMTNVEESISTLGLNSVIPDVELANVSVNGVMYAVGNLTKDDISVAPDVSKVTGAGVYELPLVGTILNANGEVQISSVTPSRITVRFDTLHSKTLAIESSLNGLKSEVGYLIQDELVNPAQVTVTGPEAEVNRINRCEIRTEVSEKLSETYSKKSAIVLLDKNGTEIVSDNLTMDVTEATVTIPVLKIREIPVELQFINVPDHFPLDELNFSLSSEAISVAGIEASIDKYASILLDHIDFKQMGLGSTYAFPVQLQTGFRNVENIQSVQVTLDGEGLSSRKMDLENVHVINVPLGYKAEPLAETLSGVELIGDTALLEALTADDIVCEVDMKSSSEIAEGQILMPVKVYDPMGRLIWAKGNYEVVVSISAATEEPAE